MAEKKKFVCDCPGPCGVDRTYEQIEVDFMAKHGHNPDAGHIHRKWRQLGRMAAGHAIKNMTGV